MIPTASGIELAQRCPGSLTIDHVQESNPHSQRGIEAHADDEAAINAGNVPEAYLERWPEVTEWRAEVAYMYDISCDDARELGVGLQRAYGDRRPFEVPGTIDAEGRGPGILVVVDKKGYSRQTPAARNPQVRFLALAAARSRPAERIEVAIAPALGGLDVATLDPDFDLDVIAAETRQLLMSSAQVRAAARDGRPVDFNIGPWCRWCNAFNACPKQEELRALVQLDDGHPARDIVHYRDLAEQYELMERARILVKRLENTIYGAASSSPIRLKSGKLFGPRQVEGNRVYNGTMIHAAIAAHPRLGREVADKAVEMKASQTQFKRIVQPLAPPRGYEALRKQIFDGVEEAGGMKRGLKTEFVEYDAEL